MRRIHCAPIDWDDTSAWGNHVHESDTGSWLDAEVSR